MKKYIKKIWELYKPFRKALIFLFILTLISQMLFLVPPILYAKVVDSVISKEPLLKSLYFVIAVFVVGFLSKVVMNYIRNYTEIKWIHYDVDRYVYNKNISKILSFSVGQNTNENSGVKQSILNRGTNAMEQAMYKTLFDAVPIILQTVLSIIAMLIINIFLGLIVFFGVALYVSLVIYLNNKFKDDLKKIDDIYNKNNKEYTEILWNIATIKLNAQEEQSQKRYDNGILRLCNLGKKVWIRYSSWTLARGGIAEITEFIVMALGVWLVYKGAYTPGTLVIFWSWSSKAFNGLGRIGMMQRQYMRWGASIKKYLDLLEIEPDIREIENPVRIKKIKGEVEFKNVSFKYPFRKNKEDKDSSAGKRQNKKIKNENLPALKKINFKIKAGQKVAFVGESGAGKSTIAQLLIRAYDVSDGRVAIDGVDIKNLDLRCYREQVGVVPQDVGVFDRTLRENIIFGVGYQKKISIKQLEDVARLSCIHKFKHRLEHGYDTMIGEKGIRLSGGERQRVGIARALIKDPAILIFDEATSHLDTENEKMIHEAIDKVSGGRTTIIIAHRLSTIKNADKIFVMDKGKIVGEGSHQELMKDCKIYQNLVAHQSVDNGNL